MKTNTLTQIFTFLFFVMLSFSINGQDLIVTHQGDSLNCKIMKIKSENIYFTFKYQDEIRNTLLPFSQVKHHQYNYYKVADVEVSQEKYKKTELPFRIAINGGWSHRFGKIPNDFNSEMRQYLKELKSGGNYGIDISYYITDTQGFGFKYSKYRSKNSHNDIMANDGSGYTHISDDISINFIGTFWATRFFDFNRKNCFIFDLGLGYIGYKNDAFIFSDLTMKGSTLGMAMNAGYDIALTQKLAVGAQISLLLGTLSEYKVSNGINTERIQLEKDKYESLSRIDISVGLRYRI